MIGSIDYIKVLSNYKINELSPNTLIFFYRLIAYINPTGAYYGNLFLIKDYFYPTTDKIKDTDISGYLDEAIAKNVLSVQLNPENNFITIRLTDFNILVENPDQEFFDKYEIKDKHVLQNVTDYFANIKHRPNKKNNEFYKDDLELNNLEASDAKTYIYNLSRLDITNKQLTAFLSSFNIQEKDTNYNSRSEKLKHFRNWLNNRKIKHDADSKGNNGKSSITDALSRWGATGKGS